MFTELDYRDYYRRIEAKEDQMVHFYRRLVAKVADDSVRKIIRNILADETEHSIMLKTVAHLLASRVRIERRRCDRKKISGIVRLKNAESGVQFLVRLLDISSRGICIESSKPLRQGDSFEMWIDFPEEMEPRHHYGKIVWERQLRPNYYNYGIQFDSRQ